MGKPRQRPVVQATTGWVNAVKCPLCPERLVVKPGKNPQKILAGHIRRRHGGTPQVS